MNTKPAFQLFVEANQELLNCYNKTSAADFAKLSDSQKETTCSSQRERVKDLLRTNNLVMSNLVRERIEILKRLGAEQEIKIRE
ncbi:hypothetical protein FGO68_gene2631 [Halteria grandinella]|uniref:Uncharacterized protein n=1 Tax=Halteria grandinella TaxID=5974 RepID=A0A8J8SWB3_HALGN|nr:hypothetical protein FGO68_gene2631 [Halteria grandinella]